MSPKSHVAAARPKQRPGRFVGDRLRHPDEQTASPELAVFFANGIGDHFIVAPALRALAQLFDGDGTLVVLEGAYERLLWDIPFRKVVTLRLVLTDGVKRFDARLLAERLGKIECFISLNPWTSPDLDELIAILSPRRVYRLADLAWDVKHSMDFAFKIPQEIDRRLQINDFAQPPSVNPRFAPAAYQILDVVRERGRKVVAMHSDTLIHKRWPAPRFRQLIELLMQDPDVSIFGVGSDLSELEVPFLSERLFLPKSLNLGLAISIVALCDFFIGVDSCFLHVADLFRVKGIGLFGPAAHQAFGSNEFGFRLAAHRHVSGLGTMGNIAVDEVYGAYGQLAADVTRHLP
jgi:hypothetical protein